MRYDEHNAFFVDFVETCCRFGEIELARAIAAKQRQIRPDAAFPWLLTVQVELLARDGPAALWWADQGLQKFPGNAKLTALRQAALHPDQAKLSGINRYSLQDYLEQAKPSGTQPAQSER
jgi:hypothetical protein